MTIRDFIKRVVCSMLLSFLLIGCNRFHPPFNDFKPTPSRWMYKYNKKAIIRQLQKQDIEYIQYGDTGTLIIPTDRYFLWNTARLNERCYAGLNNVVHLVKLFPCSRVYVAAFTDNVGQKRYRALSSQAQAETMIAFLWANGIPAEYLRAEGFGSHYPIADNHIVHGSAMNRRIEIQWVALPEKPVKAAPASTQMK